MWTQYLKTFWTMQIAIALLLMAARWFVGMSYPDLMIVLGALEVASVFGAWWGARLKRRVEQDPDLLPPMR